MNEQQLEALKKVIEYLEPDESRHFEESDKPRCHIYRDILMLKKFLKNIPG